MSSFFSLGKFDIFDDLADLGLRLSHSDAVLGRLSGEESFPLVGRCSAALKSEIFMTFTPDIEVAWTWHEILHILIFQNVVLLVLGLQFVGTIKLEVFLPQFFLQFL